jgi:hypothetical protein
MSISTAQSIVTTNLKFYHDPYNRRSYKGASTSQQFVNPYDLSDAAWVKNKATITADTGLDGIFTGAYILTDSGGTDLHWVGQAVGTPQTTYTMSVYAKARTHHLFWMAVYGEALGVFDLINGVCAVGGTGTVTIEDASKFCNFTNGQPLGPGWYRCSVTFTRSNTTLGAYYGLWDTALGQTYPANGRSIYLRYPLLDTSPYLSPPVDPIDGVDRNSIEAHVDLTGYSDLSTVANNPAVVIESGTDYSYNGTSTHLTIPHSSITTLAGDMTICAWVKPTSFANSKSTIIGKNDVANPAPYHYYLNSSGNLVLARGNGLTVNTQTLQSTSTLTANTWTHVAVTSSSNLITHYINTVESGTGTVSTTISGVTVEILIGARDGMGDFFTGKIGGLQLYSSALTQEQILQNYNATKWRYT